MDPFAPACHPVHRKTFYPLLALLASCPGGKYIDIVTFFGQLPCQVVGAAAGAATEGRELVIQQQYAAARSGVGRISVRRAYIAFSINEKALNGEMERAFYTKRWVFACTPGDQRKGNNASPGSDICCKKSGATCC